MHISPSSLLSLWKRRERREKEKKNASSNYKPKLWILTLDFWRGDVSRAFADAWNNLQCFCSICSEDGWNKYFKLINVRPAVPSTWLALVNIDGREREREAGLFSSTLLFVQDSACHINRYEYWMRAERCCARHSQGSTLQIKLFSPLFIKLTIKQLMVQTSCRDLF